MNEYYVFDGDTTLYSELPFSMPLKVAYEDKEEVKQLGARWDNEKKHWYAPAGADISDFDYYLPDYNIITTFSQSNTIS